MPFLSVSCDAMDKEIELSGFDMAMRKDNADPDQAGNLLAFILIIPSAVLFAVSFARISIIARAVAYITAALIDAVTAFGIKAVLETQLHRQFNGLLDSVVRINIKPGFILYIAFNLILLCAGIILLVIFSRETLRELKNFDIEDTE